MVKTTRAQRVALKKIHARARTLDTPTPDTYRQFRRRVQGTICCDNAVIVQYAHMWLMVETDGHVHS